MSQELEGVTNNSAEDISDNWQPPANWNPDVAATSDFVRRLLSQRPLNPVRREIDGLGKFQVEEDVIAIVSDVPEATVEVVPAVTTALLQYALPIKR